MLIRCCGIAPDNAEAWNALGLALRATNAPGLALTAFITAQRLRPDCVDYVLAGVEATMEAKEGEGELRTFERGVSAGSAQPGQPGWPRHVAGAHGPPGEAIDALEAATELTPDTLVPLRLLAGVLARSSRVGHAEHVLRRLRSLDPDNPQASNDHAAVLMRLHQHAAARAILLEVLDSYGPDISILCNLANATACVGLQDEAVAITRRAIGLDPRAVLPRRALCNVLAYREGTTGAELLAAMRDCSAALPRRRSRRWVTIVIRIAGWWLVCCRGRCDRIRWGG